MAEDRPNAAVGLLTGGSRALATQLFSFYIRVPVKLFRPARFDYTSMLKSSLADKLTGPYRIWTHSSPALLFRAIREHGWRFVPDKLLPPIIANSVVGTVLYTTYLSTLTILKHTSGLKSADNPTIRQTFVAGGLAGAAQAAVATPLDAIAIRFDADVMTSETSLWKYARDQLRDIGPRAAYGGILLNLAKESAGFALFFSAFEFVKGPVYRSYSSWWYAPSYFHPEGRKKSRIMYPVFVLTGGCLAAAAMQAVSYPMSKIQKLHTIRLQAIDQHAGKHSGWTVYLHSYHKTFLAVERQVAQVSKGSWLNWMYGGIGRYTMYSMPSTSIGLLIFEILRIRMGAAPDAAVQDHDRLQADPAVLETH